MKRVIKHIEQLLYKEECVVVPGLGAFLRHDRSAELDANKGLILPGHSELSFNGQLDHNDGLLVQSYSQAYSLGYKRALALVQKDVEELLSTLRTRGVVQMGNIGKLTMERTEGRIAFIPNAEHPFSVEYYGLMPVSLLPQLQSVEDGASNEGRKKRQGDVVYLPVNLRYVRYTAAAVAIGAAIFFFPKDALNFNTDRNSPATQHQAGFGPISTNEAKAPVSKPVVAEAPAEEVTVTAAPAEIAAEEVQTQATLGGKPLYEAPLETTKYMVVISSLDNRAEAERFLQNNPNFADFPNAGVYEARNGRVRIFADAFDTKESAREALNDIVAKPRYKTAWIYTAK